MDDTLCVDFPEQAAKVAVVPLLMMMISMVNSRRPPVYLERLHFYSTDDLYIVCLVYTFLVFRLFDVRVDFCIDNTISISISCSLLTLEKVNIHATSWRHFVCTAILFCSISFLWFMFCAVNRELTWFLYMCKYHKHFCSLLQARNNSSKCQQFILK